MTWISDEDWLDAECEDGVGPLMEFLDGPV